MDMSPDALAALEDRVAQLLDQRVAELKDQIEDLENEKQDLQFTIRNKEIEIDELKSALASANEKLENARNAAAEIGRLDLDEVEP